MNLYNQVLYYLNNNKLLNHLIFILLATGCFVRLHFYFDYKDLWLDELSLAQSILEMNLLDLLRFPLLHGQSAPIGFIVISELLNGYFLNNYKLYLFPLMSSLCLLFLAYKFMKSNFNLRYVVIYLSFFVMNYSLIYYSTEFKQYMTEALMSFILIYYFYEYKDFLSHNFSWKFTILLCILTLFSSSLPFIICGIACAIIYKHKSIKKTLNYIKINFVKLLVFLLFYLSYYQLYLTRASLENMQRYWKFSFFPLQLDQVIPWVKQVFFPVMEHIYYIPHNIAEFRLGGIFFLVFFLYGSLILFKKNKELFFCTCVPLIAVIIVSAFKMYPLGHSGVRGTRLVLFLYPLVLIPISVASMHIIDIIFRKNFFINILLCFLVLLTLKNNISYVKSPHQMQQTKKIVEYIHSNYTQDFKLIIQNTAIRAFKVYSNRRTIDYIIFNKNENIIEFAEKIFKSANKCMFFFSHYNIKTATTLISYAKSMKLNVIRIQDRGAELIIITK